MELTHPMIVAGATIVVVGSGAAGLSAALAAAEAARSGTGRCRIVLIDRAPNGQHGGNTRWSPSYMRMAAPDRVAPDFEASVQAASSGRADPAYFRRLSEEAPAAIDWLAHHGVTFHQPVYYLSAGSARIQPVGGGNAILAALEGAARAAGVDIRYEVRAERLLCGSDGGVVGVEVRLGNGALELIGACAVVLACGGFAGNGEMLGQHIGAGAESLQPISPGTRFNTGDGICMALAAGAQPSGDWQGMHVEPVDPRSRSSAAVALVYPYGILVDRDGRRFIDEVVASCTRRGSRLPAPSIWQRRGASPTPFSTRGCTRSPAMGGRSGRRCRPIRQDRSLSLPRRSASRRSR
jgi:tricarballylate dehydrogenase